MWPLIIKKNKSWQKMSEAGVWGMGLGFVETLWAVGVLLVAGISLNDFSYYE